MWLVAGLGNPGPDYASHRHNIGFMVVDELRRRFEAEAPRTKFGSELCQVERRGGPERERQRIYLQKPMEYMNLSGQAVQRAMAFYRIEPAHVLVVHDEIDLPLGRIRVKVGGGHGGHNGLRSISSAVGPDYLRVRCGVGRPAKVGKEHVVGHVLSAFNRAEQAELPELIGRAADAVEMVLDRGPAHAMNQFNKDSGPAAGSA
jgi:PTH1 family peptidyl-tRNA hydrolase